MSASLENVWKEKEIEKKLLWTTCDHREMMKIKNISKQIQKKWSMAKGILKEEAKPNVTFP